MKIRNEIDCRCAVIATLSDDGETFAVKMTATAEYDEETGATATATISVPPEHAQAILDAMKEALDACAPKAHTAMFDTISTMRKVATEAGEI